MSTQTTTTTQTIYFSKQLLQTLPPEVFEKSNQKAFITILKTLTCIIVSYYFLLSLPYYTLPLTWIITGTAITGLLTIGHDCGHNSFFLSEKMNQVVGSLAFLPLLYPLESWKLHHNVHHHHADQRSEGNHQQKNKHFKRLINPIYWLYDLGEYFVRYFDLSQFPIEQQNSSRASVLLVYFYASIFFPTIIYNLGVWSLIKLWVVPWLIFHFWKNSLSQFLMGIIVDQKAFKLHHFQYPKWVEILCHDANYLIPHYLSTSIPSYNCRLAHNILLSSEFGNYIEEHSWLYQPLQNEKDESNKKQIQEFHLNTSSQQPQHQQQKKTFNDLIAFLSRVHWFHCIVLFGSPLVALYGLYTTEICFNTLLFAIIYYYCTGLGITAGYHRLWAHRAYSASLPVHIILMLFGSGALQGTIRWWCRDHRAHHRFTDTPKDPYSAQEGFFWSHIGWILMKQEPHKLGKVEISDLNACAIIRFQHKNFLWLGPLMALVVPTLVAGLGWDDYWGGFYFAGVVRLVVVHHATFFVNSLAHTLGSKSFDDKHSPCDSWITALLTLGEGYHNFHHEFPQDYRNGIRFYHYDPTKWIIRLLAFFGLTYNLEVFPENEVLKGYAQMSQKKLDKLKINLDWGPDITSLPEFTLEDTEKLQNEGRDIIIIDGFVHDVKKFIDKHPGGPAILQIFLGKDATEVFNGKVYDHSNAARNLLSSFRIGRFIDPELHDADPSSH